MNDVMRDAKVVTSLFLTACLVYAGYELIKVEVDGQNNKQLYTVLVPEPEYGEFRDDFHAGRLQISDAQSLGKSYAQVAKIRQSVGRGGVWTNPDYTRLQHEMSRTK